MKKVLLFICFVFGNLTILAVCFLFLTIKTSKQSSALQSAPLETMTETEKPYLQTGSITPVNETIQAEIISGNASEQLAEAFFKKYNSPMVGLGKDIVAAAQKYQIPVGILPAIGQCEGNLGKSMPNNSYNTWGFGVYGTQVIRFSSWQEAINTVSKAVRTDYFDYGLTTPEKMMTKYTPSSDGSWANCVTKFLQDFNSPQS